VSLIEKANIVGFDWEASGLNVYGGNATDYPLGFSVSVAINNDPDNIVSEYFAIGHTQTPELNVPEAGWKYLLYLVTQRVAVVHNAIYDMAVTRLAGFELKKFICTMKYNHLLNENHQSYSLEAVSTRVLGYSAKTKSPIFEMAMLAYGWDMPVNIMRDYALSDADGTLKTCIMDMRNARKANENRLGDYWTGMEAPATQCLSFMRKWGVRIDTDKCREEERKGLLEKERITEFFGFNPGSGIGLKKLLIEELGLPPIYNVKKNKAGEIVQSQTFDKKAMERYELMLAHRDETEDNELVRELLTYRGWTKSVSSYYLPYQKLLDDDGRLRPAYRTNGTKTGRWSCADPNMQQIPKETNKVWNGSIKDCVISADGFSGWEIDYAQLEFRLAASASHSDNLVEIFADPNRDIFTEMAKDLGWERNPVKGFTYTTLYGGGVTRIMDAFGVSEGEAREMTEHFFGLYPNLRAASKRAEAQAKSQGYVEIWSGRRRHFQNPQKEAFKAFNSFIQGGAADIVKGVMIKLFHEVINEDCRMLLQVHDSLWFEIRQGMEGYYLPKIMEIMRRPSAKFNVRLDVDAHPWSKREAKKVEDYYGTTEIESFGSKVLTV
jgi:DNA polymerase-1